MSRRSKSEAAYRGSMDDVREWLTPDVRREEIEELRFQSEERKRRKWRDRQRGLEHVDRSSLQ